MTSCSLLDCHFSRKTLAAVGRTEDRSRRSLWNVAYLWEKQGVISLKILIWNAAHCTRQGLSLRKLICSYSKTYLSSCQKVHHCHDKSPLPHSVVKQWGERQQEINDCLFIYTKFLATLLYVCFHLCPKLYIICNIYYINYTYV